MYEDSLFNKDGIPAFHEFMSDEGLNSCLCPKNNQRWTTKEDILTLERSGSFPQISTFQYRNRGGEIVLDFLTSPTANRSTVIFIKLGDDKKAYIDELSRRFRQNCK